MSFAMSNGTLSLLNDSVCFCAGCSSPNRAASLSDDTSLLSEESSDDSSLKLTQDSTTRNCVPDMAVVKGYPATPSSAIERYEHTDIDTKHKICMIQKLKSTPIPTNYIPEQKASCESPTKAPISTMNYGLHREKANTQLHNRWTNFAPDANAMDIVEQNPSSLAIDQQHVHPKQAPTPAIALVTSTSTINRFKQYKTSIAGDGDCPNLNPTNHNLAISTTHPDRERYGTKTTFSTHASRASDLGTDIEMSPSSIKMTLG